MAPKTTFKYTQKKRRISKKFIYKRTEREFSIPQCLSKTFCEKCQNEGIHAKRIWIARIRDMYTLWLRCLVVDLKFPDPISIKGYHTCIYVRVFVHSCVRIRNRWNFHSHSFHSIVKIERHRNAILFPLFSICLYTFFSLLLSAYFSPCSFPLGTFEECIHLMQWLHLNNTNMAKCSSAERH